MNNVIKLRTVRQARAKGKTLCGHGFQPLLRILRPRHSHIPVQHKWKLVTGKRFDVKQGKLMTVERCKRCGEERTRLL